MLLLNDKHPSLSYITCMSVYRIVFVTHAHIHRHRHTHTYACTHAHTTLGTCIGVFYFINAMVARILHNDLFNIFSRQDDGKQPKCNPTDDENCQRSDKEEKVLVISLPNAVVHPWAVMIKILKGNKQIHNPIIVNTSMGLLFSLHKLYSINLFIITSTIFKD